MTEIERKAIAAAGLYLEMRHYEVLEKNYHRARALIDIIAQKNDTTYFVDVIYRADELSAQLLASDLSLDRLRSLLRGAQSWEEEEKHEGSISYGVIEIIGKQFQVLSFTDNLII